jgi:hypothetical protein
MPPDTFGAARDRYPQYDFCLVEKLSKIRGDQALNRRAKLKVRDPNLSPGERRSSNPPSPRKLP